MADDAGATAALTRAERRRADVSGVGAAVCGGARWRRWCASMDETQQMDAELVREMFALGLMGIVVPEEYGGAGGSFFDAVLAVEATVGGGPGGGRAGGCAEHAVRERAGALGDAGAEAAVSAAAGGGDGGRVCAERGGVGVGCVCAGDAGGEARQRLCAERAEAVDHECEGGGAVYRLRDDRSGRPGTRA